jgi:cell wall-associated NlpC family hydrolase
MRSVLTLPAVLLAVLAASLVVLVAPAGPAHAAERPGRVAKAFRIVRAQQGDPYRYGAAGPNAFDCSGLVYYSYRRAGFRNIPRTSSAQARHARRIKRKSLRPGDFVFFHSGGSVYHVAVFAGWRNGRRTIIHAPNSNQRVRRDPIWTDSWFAGTLRRG